MAAPCVEHTQRQRAFLKNRWDVLMEQIASKGCSEEVAELMKIERDPIGAYQEALWKNDKA